MQDGKIVESGTHKELIEKGAVYADLYHAQVSSSQVSDGDAEPTVESTCGNTHANTMEETPEAKNLDVDTVHDLIRTA